MSQNWLGQAQDRKSQLHMHFEGSCKDPLFSKYLFHC